MDAIFAAILDLYKFIDDENEFFKSLNIGIDIKFIVLTSVSWKLWRFINFGHGLGGHFEFQSKMADRAILKCASNQIMNLHIKLYLCTNFHACTQKCTLVSPSL